MADTIPLIGPNGDVVQTTPEGAKVALGAGYRVPTPEQLEDINQKAQLKAEEGGTTGALKTGVEAALQALTFGLSTQAETRLGISTPERVAAREELHPGAHAIGTGVGLALPLIATAGTAAPEEGAALTLGQGVNKAAGFTAPGLISKAGRAVASATERALGTGASTPELADALKILSGQFPEDATWLKAATAAPQPLGTRLAHSALSQGLAAGTEGMLWGASDVIHEQALHGDDPGFVGQALSTIGLSALLGGGIGTGLGILGTGAKAGMPKLVDWLKDYQTEKYATAMGLKASDPEVKAAIKTASKEGLLGWFTNAEKFAARAADFATKAEDEVTSRATPFSDLTTPAAKVAELAPEGPAQKSFLSWLDTKAQNPISVGDLLDAAKTKAVDPAYAHDLISKLTVDGALDLGEDGPALRAGLKLDEALEKSRAANQLKDVADKAAASVPAEKEKIGLAEVAAALEGAKESLTKGLVYGGGAYLLRQLESRYGPAVEATLAGKLAEKIPPEWLAGSGGEETLKLANTLKAGTPTSVSPDRITQIAVLQRATAMRDAAREALGVNLSATRGLPAETLARMYERPSQEPPAVNAKPPESPSPSAPGPIPPPTAGMPSAPVPVPQKFHAPADMASAEKAAALVYAKRAVDDVKEAIDAKAKTILSGKVSKEGPPVKASALKDVQTSIETVRHLANNPELLMKAVQAQIGDLADHAPDTGMEASRTMTAGIQYLASVAPAPSVPPSVLEPSPSPSKLDLITWAAKEAAVKDPIAALNSNYDQSAVMATIRAVYPALAAGISASVAAAMVPDPKHPMSLQTAQRASFYAGLPLVSQLTPSAIQAYQTPLNPPKPPEGPKKRTSKSGFKSAGFGKRSETPSESVGGAFTE